MTRNRTLSLTKIRRAVADYMQTEGCSCCQDYEGHQEHRATLGKLLKVAKYTDRSGYDFSRYRTPRSHDEALTRISR